MDMQELIHHVTAIVTEQHGSHHREAVEHAVEETLFQALLALRNGGRLDLGYCGEIERADPAAPGPDNFLWHYSPRAKDLPASGNLEQEAA